jgi:hypothetical protein
MRRQAICPPCLGHCCPGRACACKLPGRVGRGGETQGRGRRWFDRADGDYQAFLKHLEEGPQTLPSATAQLEAREAEQRAAALAGALAGRGFALGLQRRHGARQRQQRFDLRSRERVSHSGWRARPAGATEAGRPVVVTPLMAFLQQKHERAAQLPRRSKQQPQRAPPDKPSAKDTKGGKLEGKRAAAAAAAAQQAGKKPGKGSREASSAASAAATAALASASGSRRAGKEGGSGSSSSSRQAADSSKAARPTSDAGSSRPGARRPAEAVASSRREAAAPAAAPAAAEGSDPARRPTRVREGHGVFAAGRGNRLFAAALGKATTDAPGGGRRGAGGGDGGAADGGAAG